MKNPFRKLMQDDKTSDPKKKELHKKITDKAWDISKKAMFRKLTAKDVDELESLYKEYHKKYPDKKQEADDNTRIAKLRSIV